MRKRAIVFDFDGVIAATYRMKLVIQIAIMMGFTVHKDSEQLMGEHWGTTTVDFLMIAFRLERMDAQRLNDAWYAYDAEHHVPFVEGIADAVKQLSADGYVLCILTSRQRESLVTLLEREGILEYFSHITALEDTRFPKPDPRAFKDTLVFLATHGIERDEIVFVGDTKIDQECGRMAGIETIIVETGPFAEWQRHTNPHESHLIVPSAAHLGDWLERAIETVA